MNRPSCHRTLAFVLAMLVPAISASGQDDPVRSRTAQVVYVDDVNPGAGGERSVEVFFRALDHQGRPVDKLVPDDLDVLEDRRAISPSSLELISLEESKLGVAVVLAIDVSPTMAASFEDVRSGAVEFIKRVGSFGRVGIVTFAGRVEEVVDFGVSEAEALRRLDEIRPEEDPAPTLVYDGIDRAVEMIRAATDRPRRAFIVVFSDGQDGGSVRRLSALLASANGDETEPLIPIYTIGYPTGFSDDGLDTLGEISKQTKALYAEAGGSRGLNPIYGRIWGQVTGTYLLRFPSDLDGRSHKVELVIDGSSGERAALYPLVERPIWPFVTAATLVALAAVGGFVIVRLRQAGRLIFESGPKEGQTVRLKPGRNKIGSLRECDIVIDLPTISKRHAEILVRPAGVKIKDTGSTNGTFVNGSPITSLASLKPGDKIRIADVDLVYQR